MKGPGGLRTDLWGHLLIILIITARARVRLFPTRRQPSGRQPGGGGVGGRDVRAAVWEFRGLSHLQGNADSTQRQEPCPRADSPDHIPKLEAEHGRGT